MSSASKCSDTQETDSDTGAKSASIYQDNIKTFKTRPFNSKIFDESDSVEFKELALDLIRRQIDQDQKVKSELASLNSRIVGHIYDKIERGHSIIYDYKCRDYLISFGYDKETTDQIINYLLDSYDDSIDLEEMKQYFNQHNSPCWLFAPGNHLQKLIGCNLMPGFIDCFNADNTLNNYDLLGTKLFKFMVNHRLTSEMINVPYVENRFTVHDLRKNILVEVERSFQEETQKNKSVCVDQQCFSCLKSCCSNEKLTGLFDGKSHTYWQTSNAEKCETHWIVINLRENIKLTSLSLHTVGNKSDEFLKSVIIEVRLGSSSSSTLNAKPTSPSKSSSPTRHGATSNSSTSSTTIPPSGLNETVIAKCDYNLTINNDYMLYSCMADDELSSSVSSGSQVNYVKLVFRRTNEKNYWGKNGDQIKIKSIKMVGKRMSMAAQSETIQDVGVCWYFEMLSVMALMQSQVMPALHVKILEISQRALEKMPPLSLTSGAKSTGFLSSPHVLQKVNDFFKVFIELTSENDRSEAILAYLSFNLARCHLKTVIDSLLLILSHSNLDFKFDSLTKKIEESRVSLKGPKHDPLKKVSEEMVSVKLAFKNTYQTGYKALINSVLWFMRDLAEQRRLYDTLDEDGPKFIDFEQFNVIDLWRLYERIKQSEDSHEFSLAIPVLLLFDELVRCNQVKENAQENADSQPSAYKDILSCLFEMIDSITSESGGQFQELIKLVAIDTLKNGVWIFFPSDAIRKKYFLDIIDHNATTEIENQHDASKTHLSLKQPSVEILFEALCTIFTIRKEYLIGHLTSENEEYNELVHVLPLLDKLMNLGLKWTKESIVKSVHDLLNSIQSCMFLSIKKNFAKNEAGVDETKEEDPVLAEQSRNSFNKAQDFLVSYTKLIISKCESYILVDSASKTSPPSDNLIKFLKNFVYNFLLWAGELLGSLDLSISTSLIERLIEFYQVIKVLSETFNEKNPVEEEKELQSWTFDSKSRTALADIQIEYSHPAANRFTIEFDSESNLAFNENSETTYNFIDSHQKSHFFSGKLDSTLWQQRMSIKSNSYILFNIRSSKDLRQTTSFFLKFKVTAIGFDRLCSSVTLDDLNDSITSLIGQHLFKVYLRQRRSLEDCFNKTVNQNHSLNMPSTTQKQDDAGKSSFLLLGYQHQMSVVSNTQFLTLNVDKNHQLLGDFNSSFYKVLFRAGLSSLSNKPDQPPVSSENSKLLDFLHQIGNYFTQIKSVDVNNEKQMAELDAETQSVREFLSIYDRNYETDKRALSSLRLKPGGLNTTELILSIFCALVWHTPSIKYDTLFEFYPELDAYKARFHEPTLRIFRLAESLRPFLVEQQQLFKNANAGHTHVNLLEILGDKVNFLLKLNRTHDYLVHYESDKRSKTQSKLSLNPTPNTDNHAESVKKKSTPSTQIPKSDLYPSYNLVFEFLFQTDPSCLASVNKILDLKRQNAIQISTNFQLVLKHVKNVLKSKTESSIYKLNVVLNLLSSFLSLSNNQSRTIKSNFTFPPSLNLNLDHYTDYLYGCGLEMEQEIKRDYFSLVGELISFTKTLRHDNSIHLASSTCPITSLECYLTCLLNINWELSDIDFLNEMKITEYLLDNAARYLPIKQYTEKDESGCCKTSSQVLEDAFDLSHAKFQKLLTTQKSNICSVFDMDCSVLDYEKQIKRIIDQIVANVDQDTNAETTEQPEIESIEAETSENHKAANQGSFDATFFPGIYQRVFQASTSVNTKSNNHPKSGSSGLGGTTTAKLDSQTLLKAIQISEIKTYEQYERFVVARYMLLKYFNKFQISFYCDGCQATLFSSRFVCLECKDHFLCFNCFADTIVKTSSSAVADEVTPDTPSNLGPFSSTHQSTHCMLLLDHTCSRCESLIIGKRYKCQECSDYSLCLMCFNETTRPETSEAEFDDEENSKHKKSHTFKVYEPVLMVARRKNVSDTQVYAYLHSRMLYNVIALKLADLSNNMLKINSNDPHVSSFTQQLDQLNSNIIRQLMTMISTSFSDSIQQHDDNQARLFSFHSQENLIGLLACIINKNLFKYEKQLKSNESGSSSGSGSSRSSPTYWTPAGSPFSLDAYLSKKKHSIDQFDIMRILLNLLGSSRIQHDHIRIMLINILKPVIIVSQPAKVDSLVKEIVSQNEKFSQAFELIDRFEITSREYTLELLAYLADVYLPTKKLTSTPLTDHFIHVIYKLSSIKDENNAWRSSVSNFISYMFDILISLLENKDKSVPVEFKSRIVHFFIMLSSSSMALSSGQWADYKNRSRYDGAGILRSILDLRVGLLRYYYNESMLGTYYVSLYEPETRKINFLNGQRYGVDFRKSTTKSKIKFNNRIELDQNGWNKAVKAFKILLNKLVKKEQTSSSDQSNHETMHINKKREVTRLLYQLPINFNLLASSLLIIVKTYINNFCMELEKKELDRQEDLATSGREKVELKDLVDCELLSLASKLAFQDTNMNPNWKLFFLRRILAFLLAFESFRSLKQEMTNEELHDSESCKNSPEKEASSRVASKVAVKQTNSSGLSIISRKQLVLSDLTDDAKTGGSPSHAVLGICNEEVSSTSSSFQFNINDMISTSSNVFLTALSDKRNKYGLKLFQNSLEKLANFYQDNNSQEFYTVSASNPASSSSPTVVIMHNSQRSKSFGMPAPIKNSIRLLSNAILVLTSRELLILFINLAAKLNLDSCFRSSIQDDLRNLALVKLNCQTEYEFLQLADVLYYTESLLKYKLFVKNLMASLISETKDNKANLTNLITMACDFMLPEFKLVKKVNWNPSVSGKSKRIQEGRLKNKINHTEETTEESLLNMSKKSSVFTESGLPVSLSQTGSKPNDIEKLAINDSNSNLLIVFDSPDLISQRASNQFMRQYAGNSLKNVFLRRQRLNTFIRQNRLITKRAVNEYDSDSSVETLSRVNKAAKNKSLLKTNRLLPARKAATKSASSLNRKKTNMGDLSDLTEEDKDDYDEDIEDHDDDDEDNSDVGKSKSNKKNRTERAIKLAGSSSNKSNRVFVTFQVLGKKARDESSRGAMSSDSAPGLISAITANTELAYDDDTNIEIFNLSDNNQNDDTDNNEDEDDEYEEETTEREDVDESRSDDGDSDEDGDDDDDGNYDGYELDENSSTGEMNVYLSTDDDLTHKELSDEDTIEDDEEDYETVEEDEDDSKIRLKKHDDNEDCPAIYYNTCDEPINDDQIEIEVKDKQVAENNKIDEMCFLLDDYYYDYEVVEENTRMSGENNRSADRSAREIFDEPDDDHSSGHQSKRAGRRTFRLALDEAGLHMPYLSIQNKRMLTWKFSSPNGTSTATDSPSNVSFKIYSTVSKNFESAFHLLEELIDQLDLENNLSHRSVLNKLWTSLIKICCVQSFDKRLKVLSLLIKTVSKVTQISKPLDDSPIINLNALRPLKSLQHTVEATAVSGNSGEDRNLSRALFELFFFAEKLACQWHKQREYLAHMKDKQDFIEKICEASSFIQFINNTYNLNESSTSTSLNQQISKSSSTKSADSKSSSMTKSHALSRMQSNSSSLDQAENSETSDTINQRDEEECRKSDENIAQSSLENEDQVVHGDSDDDDIDNEEDDDGKSAF